MLAPAQTFVPYRAPGGAGRLAPDRPVGCMRGLGRTHWGICGAPSLDGLRATQPATRNRKAFPLSRCPD
jgi:hypothetical protein